MRKIGPNWIVILIVVSLAGRTSLAEDSNAKSSVSPSPLSMAVFDIDATPPVGTMMAYDRVRRVEELGLRCRGVVLIPDGDPIVLCAVDWIGIGNEGHDEFRRRIASAAGTVPARVAVHTLHQHDAPRCDFSAERLLHHVGVSDLGAFDSLVARDVLDRLGLAIAAAMENPIPVTHAAFGSAVVQEIASNRRILGDDGKVRAVRFTTCRDAKLRAEPVGVIDPVVDSVTFFDQEKPIAVLSYYACHPQSYYRTGVPSPDFPGIARFMRGQDVPDVMHVHFCGAGGNIGAGKYNDGSKENRLTLAERLAEGMKTAYESATKFAVDSGAIRWTTEPVALPLAKHLKVDELRAELSDWKSTQYWGSPDKLAFATRCQENHKIDIACLSIGDVRILHMPGELFVEYQLAAKAMRPDLHVMMAAYGDYGPGYIGTAEAYPQGGYETSQPASNVSPDVERVLTEAMAKLLETQP